MTTTATQKKCWNCKEAVHPYASACPYCGVELPIEATGDDGENEEALAPPYRLVNTVSQEAPASPFGQANSFFSTEETAEVHEEKSVETPPVEEPVASSKSSLKQVAIPLTTLLAGSVFFMFGLVLLLYAKEGVFTLHWNGNLWPYFLFSSLVLLFIGWRTLQNVYDPQECD